MSSIPPDSPWRGCAAYYPQPLGQEEELGAQFLQETIYYFNCRLLDPPLGDIIYRNSARESDVTRHVYRWDSASYEDVFRDGFQARRQQNTPDDVFHNLEHYINNGGRPLQNSQHPTNYAFISTTLSSGWHPALRLPPNQDRLVVEAWRYEIYAPGGILVHQTLGDRYRFESQEEVTFVAGIAPQYIRSAQRFNLINEGYRYTRRERADTNLILNTNFNPQSHPQRLINIQRPTSYYRGVSENAVRYIQLNTSYYPATDDDGSNNDSISSQRRLLSFISTSTASTTSSIRDWYKNGVGNIESYIDAAFRSSRTNEAYIFMKNEYVLINYAPASTRDKILNGPLFISDGFPSVKGTVFSEYGIDCAFGSHNKNESFIFSGNLCARINFAPGTTNDYIIDGPMNISTMFPFFKKTVFENGVDAAFESSSKYEAYIFKGDQYALINYNKDKATSRVIAIRSITQGFGSLRNTIFETGIDAAFASHRYNAAYIFKGDSYALINFAPGSTKDYIIGGVKKILPHNWPSLKPILPRHNRGIDLPADDESHSIAQRETDHEL